MVVGYGVVCSIGGMGNVTPERWFWLEGRGAMAPVLR